MRGLAITLLLFLLCACGGSRTGNDPGGVHGGDSTIVNAPAPVTDGPLEVKAPDGKLRMQGNMRGGKRHGIWTSYYPDGTVQSRSDYVDGALTGPTVVHHPNGQVYYTGDYFRGRELGKWRFYDLDGSLLKTLTYDSSGTIINDR